MLKRIGIARADVETLAPPAAHGRERLASEALRPAATSELWKDRLADAGFGKHADAAMQNIAVIEAGNAEEEALAIAVACARRSKTRNKTAALVTPDVALGRRVMAALARWNVPVDDSRGVSLADTPEGVFARLAAQTALDGVAPVPLLALLKHPCAQIRRRRRRGAGARHPARAAAETRHRRACTMRLAPCAARSPGIAPKKNPRCTIPIRALR